MADNKYKLKFTLSDGTVVDAGTFVAPQGEKGDKGDPGSSSSGYVANITASNWSGSSAKVYVYPIAAATHGKGTNPIVEVYDSSGDKVSVGINVDTKGNVLLSSTFNISCKIIII